VLQTITQSSPHLVCFHRHPKKMFCEGELDVIATGHWEPFHLYLEDHEIVDDEHEYDEPYHTDDVRLFVRRTRKSTGAEEVIPCEIVDYDEWGWADETPHDPLVHVLLCIVVKTPIPSDLPGARLERGRREGRFIAIDCVLGTNRHPAFWVDIETGDIFETTSWSERGQLLETVPHISESV
jgi:hypothetical protein